MLVAARPVGAEHAQADPRHRQVEHDDAADAEQQPARQVAARIAHLAGEERGRLPAAVGEEHRPQRGAEGGQEAERDGPIEHRRRRFGVPAREERAADDEAGDGDHLEDHEEVLRRSPGAHAEAVDDGKRHQRGGGDRRICRTRKRDAELARVAGEGDRHGSHATAQGDEQEPPAVDEAEHRVVRLAKVGILPAHLRTPRGELGPHEGAEHGDDAADQPRAEDEARRVDLARHQRRVHEDPRTDDAAHHDERGVDRTETASEARRGGLRRRNSAGIRQRGAL